MIKLAIIFLVISLIAGVLGYTQIAVGFKAMAKTLFYLTLAGFLLVVIFLVAMGMLAF